MGPAGWLADLLLGYPCLSPSATLAPAPAPARLPALLCPRHLDHILALTDIPHPPPWPALQTTASEAHVRQALELFKTSTMDAVKSGLMDVAVFTDEQR